MAIQPGAVFQLFTRAQLTALAGYGAGPDGEIKIDEEFGSGSGDNLAENLHASSRNLGASANETIDLQTILNGNGAALNAAQVVVFIIKAAATNTGTLRIDDSSTNPWSALLSSSGATDDARLDIAPGACLALVSTGNATYPVSGTSKTFVVTNTVAAAATYELFVLTRDT